MAQKRPRKPAVLASTNPGQSLLLNTNKRRNTTSDWASLPEDLLVLILNRLVTLPDYVRFTAVCMPWYTVALKNYHGESRLKLFMYQPPLLFLSHTQSSKKGEATIDIHNVTQNKTYKLKSFIPNANGSEIRWCGSSHGWLITVDKNYVITLSNPFCSKVKGGDGIICLPPVPRTTEFGIVKVILSADPIVAPNDYMVMVICTISTTVRILGELAFIRPGDKGCWTFIEGNRSVVDVIYSEGMFYAIFIAGFVKIWDISGRRPKLNMVSDNYFSTASPVPKSYIVELADGSILKFVRILETVHRENNKVYYVTKEFKVFKLLLVQKPNWVEVETKDRLVLGDGALFLDDNTSIYVSAAASNFFGCHPNSIYFTDDCAPGNTYPKGVCPSTDPYKIGIFNLEDGSFQWHCVSKFMFSRKSKSRPIWIRPTFQGKLPTN